MENTALGLKDYGILAKNAGVAWSGDNASRLAAALSYYAIFSLAPLLAILIAIVGLVFGEEAARNQISGEISGWVGPQTAETIQTAVAATGASPTSGAVTIVIGLGTLLFGASTFFGELKNALNTIWGVTIKPGRPIMTIISERILSFSMVLSIGLLLLMSLVVSAVLSGVSEWMAGVLPLHPILWKAVDFVVSLAVVTTLFALIFRILPNVKVSWRNVWPGAIFTALLFSIGKSLIAWYLGFASVGSVFGAAGSIVVVLMWLYYATSIFLLGAEYTKACTLRRDGIITPDAHGILLGAPASPIPPESPRD